MGKGNPINTAKHINGVERILVMTYDGKKCRLGPFYCCGLKNNRELRFYKEFLPCSLY